MIKLFCPVPVPIPSPLMMKSERNNPKLTRHQRARQESAFIRDPAGTPLQKNGRRAAGTRFFPSGNHFGAEGRRGSLTVECALSLPVFLFACVTLISVMNAVRIQTEADLKAVNRAETLALASATSGEAPAPSSDPAAWIDLCAPQAMAFPLSLPGISSLKFYTSARVARWTGGGISGASAEGNDSEDPVVFVTDNRSVYHTHADCTYLSLSIYASTVSDIRNLRNRDGGKYYPCRGFPKNYQGPVYATSTGTYYYPSLNYSALKRHVHTARLSECDHLSECTRCRSRG